MKHTVTFKVTRPNNYDATERLIRPAVVEFLDAHDKWWEAYQKGGTDILNEPGQQEPFKANNGCLVEWVSGSEKE